MIFEPFRPEGDYLAVLVVCGCPVYCTLRPEELRKPQIIPVGGPDELFQVKTRLEERLFTAW